MHNCTALEHVESVMTKPKLWRMSGYDGAVGPDAERTVASRRFGDTDIGFKSTKNFFRCEIVELFR